MNFQITNPTTPRSATPPATLRPMIVLVLIPPSSFATSVDDGVADEAVASAAEGVMSCVTVTCDPSRPVDVDSCSDTCGGGVVTGGSVDVDELDVVGGGVEEVVEDVVEDVVEVEVGVVDVVVGVELVVLVEVLVDVGVVAPVDAPASVPVAVAVPVPVSGGSRRPRTTNSLLNPAFAEAVAAKTSHKSSKSDRARAEWALMLWAKSDPRQVVTKVEQKKEEGR